MGKGKKIAMFVAVGLVLAGIGAYFARSGWWILLPVVAGIIPLLSWKKATASPTGSTTVKPYSTPKWQDRILGALSYLFSAGIIGVAIFVVGPLFLSAAVPFCSDRMDSAFAGTNSTTAPDGSKKPCEKTVSSESNSTRFANTAPVEKLPSMETTMKPGSAWAPWGTELTVSTTARFIVSPSNTLIRCVVPYQAAWKDLTGNSGTCLNPAGCGKWISPEKDDGAFHCLLTDTYPEVRVDDAGLSKKKLKKAIRVTVREI